MDNDLERIITQSKYLAKEATAIYLELFKRASNKDSTLLDIIERIAQIMYHYADLRVDIIKKEKK